MHVGTLDRKVIWADGFTAFSTLSLQLTCRLTASARLFLTLGYRSFFRNSEQPLEGSLLPLLSIRSSPTRMASNVAEDPQCGQTLREQIR